VDLSEILGFATPSKAGRMRAAIRTVGRRTPLSAAVAARAPAAVLADKKRDGRELKEVLLAGPGRPHVRRIDARRLAGLVGEWV